MERKEKEWKGGGKKNETRRTSREYGEGEREGKAVFLEGRSGLIFSVGVVSF